MGATALYINGFDTSRLGLLVERVAGWIDGPERATRTIPIAGREGAILASTPTESGPRTIDVRGVMQAESVAALRANVDQLKDLLAGDFIEARFVDQVDRFAIGRCRSFRVPPTPPQFVNRKTVAEFSLLCADPLAYDTEPIIVGFSAQKAALPLGTARIAPTIRVMGSVNNPVVTYRNHAGVSKQTMGFTVNLAATDYLEIDCHLATITKYASGVSSDGISLLTSGDFIRPDPADGSYLDSTWPSIELSAGAGECAYRRGWR